MYLPYHIIKCVFPLQPSAIRYDITPPELKTVSVEHLILHDLRIYQIIITIINLTNYFHHYDYYRRPKTIIRVPLLNIITNYVLITFHPH